MTKDVEKLYITEIEASKRYGFSRAWFQRVRWSGTPKLPYLKLPGSSKILYPLAETDAWFKNQKLITSTAQEGGNQND